MDQGPRPDQGPRTDQGLRPKAEGLAWAGSSAGDDVRTPVQHVNSRRSSGRKIERVIFLIPALIVAVVPFVLPIISLVRQAGLRAQLQELEHLVRQQQHEIDVLTRRVDRQPKEAPPAAVAAPPVAQVPTRPPVASAPPPVAPAPPAG